MKIEATIKKLKNIFVGNERFYQVPNYQRPYSWDADNLADLIDDLVTAYSEDKNENYFCGSLVLVKNEKDKDVMKEKEDRFNVFDIIDGQQRITTFTIIFCVFRDVYQSKLREKAKDYINESIRDKYSQDREKLKLLTNEKSQIDFKSTVLNGIDFKEVKNIAKDISDNKYVQNAYYIRSFLEEYISDEEKNIDVNEFVEWIFEKVVVTFIECPSEDSAIQIFNVLNTRGMPLSPIDILKSSLMQNISEEDDRSAFKRKWEDIDLKLESAKLNFDDMLNAYLYCKISSNPKKRLDKELLNVFRGKNTNPTDAVKEISDFSDAYIKTLKEKNKSLYCLRYLSHKIYWTSILSTALFGKYPHCDELKSLLLAYYYQNWIAGATVARIKQTSFNILKLVNDKQSIDEIKLEMKENLEYYGTTKTFKEELQSNYVYGRKWSRPILLLVDYFSSEGDEANFIHLERKLQLEHVLPQNPEEGSSWTKDFNELESQEWTDSLANLTLLSLKKNVQASNHSFEEKVAIYTDKDNVITRFLITQDIAKCEEWGVPELKERKGHLLKRIMAKLDLFE